MFTWVYFILLKYNFREVFKMLAGAILMSLSPIHIFLNTYQHFIVKEQITMEHEYTSTSLRTQFIIAWTDYNEEMYTGQFFHFFQ